LLPHLHIRKRSQKKVEPYPARTPALRFLDRAIYIAGAVGPLFTLPQLIKIYYFQDASGVSAVSWGAYALLDIPWILYGIVHRERPITLTYVLWFLFNLAVFIGALIYSNNPF
jgi:uncharacterized protein with PQ loop repeat